MPKTNLHLPDCVDQVVVVSFEGLSLREQAQHVAGAAVVVAAHGAALANLMFMHSQVGEGRRVASQRVRPRVPVSRARCAMKWLMMLTASICSARPPHPPLDRLWWWRSRST
jgi:capsular polysaccharide biosynthesis protein